MRKGRGSTNTYHPPSNAHNPLPTTHHPGEKGPWIEGNAEMLALGLQCSVLQVLDSGFFHADPHRGNLLRTPEGKLAYLDFGMMANVTTSNRLGLISVALGLQNRDLGLVAQNLVNLGFLPDATDVERLVPVSSHKPTPTNHQLLATDHPPPTTHYQPTNH